MSANYIRLSEADGTSALIAPDLGGWLLGYSRPVANRGIVEALHWSQDVVGRYPKEMWAGNPVLFPLVSFNHLPNQAHHYEWAGRVFPMGQHGFARRSKWTVISQSASSLAMELTDTESTRRDYPFQFRQRLTYQLAKGRLHWEQVIENTGEELMPFSTGFHPYFKLPLADESRREDCLVELPEAVLITPGTTWSDYTEKPFPAQSWSVQEDVSGTMFLTQLKKQELILIDRASRLEVVFNFEDAPLHRFVALWSRSTQEPFYCLEPWTALPNSFTRHPTGEIIVLEPKKTFRAAMWMEIRSMR